MGIAAAPLRGQTGLIGKALSHAFAIFTGIPYSRQFQASKQAAGAKGRAVEFEFASLRPDLESPSKCFCDNGLNCQKHTACLAAASVCLETARKCEKTNQDRWQLQAV